jgi:glycosyltransferase involved in cell wall biosynthesis
VPPGRADSLAEAIGGLLADPEARRRMGAAGRQRVEAEFEIGACARRVAELMREVATP